MTLYGCKQLGWVQKKELVEQAIVKHRNGDIRCSRQWCCGVLTTGAVADLWFR